MDIEKEIMEDMEKESDIYSVEGVDDSLEDEMITASEAAFMQGYNEDRNEAET